MKKRAWMVSLLGCIALLMACTDEYVDTYMSEVPEVQTQSRLAKTNCMEQNTKGEWVTSQRVPLVGDGRMVNTLTNALVSVAGNAGGGHVDYLLDTDLTNAAAINTSAVGANLIMNTLVSVKDVYHTYAAHQSAGFVIRSSNPGLLDVKALNGFWIALYRDGEQVQLKGANSGDGGSLLGLHLLAPSNRDGQMAIAVNAEASFDEIRLGVYGVQANVLEAVQVMYAYVGDNPMIPLEKGHAPAPFNPSIYDSGFAGTWTYNMVHEERLVDGDLTNTAMKATSVLVDIGGAITVNAGGALLEPGMEVGYQMGGFDPLKVSLGNTELSVYAQNDKHKVATLREGGLLGLALLGDERSTCSLVIPEDAKENGQYIYMRFPGGLALFDVVKLYHAYIRKPVEIDLTSYFSVGDGVTDNNFYQLSAPDPSVGTVKYEVISCPPEYPTDKKPTWSEITPNRLNGLIVEGNYKVQMTFTHVDGKSYTQEITIHRNKVLSADAACDQLFYIGDEYGSRLGASSGTNACVICVGGNNVVNQEYLLDANKSSYTTVINLIELIGSHALATVEFGTKDFHTNAPTRIGFALQVSSELLNLKVLELFTISCKDKEGHVVKEGTGVADGNKGISVGLLGGSGGKVRFSVDVPAGSDIHSVELRMNKLVTVSLSGLRIYYMFHEPVAGNCASASARLGDACMEMMTPASYGTKINFAAMGGHAASVGGGIKDLYNFIDDKKETYASFNDILQAVEVQEVPVRFNEMKPFQTIGVLLGADTHLLNANLLESDIEIIAYHKGNKVATFGKGGGALGLQVLGYGDSFMIEATPDRAYDEIRVLLKAGILSLSKSFKLFGLFTRRDDNGNGTPDCSEEEDVQNLGLNFKSMDTHVCVNQNEGTAAVKAVITGGKGNEKVTLTFQNYKDNQREKVVTTALATLQGVEAKVYLPCGDWFLVNGTYLDEKNAEQTIQGIASQRVMVHPRQTTWTAANTIDATDWLRWDNWSEGIPWSCTDVLIPGDMKNYPVLKAEAAADKEFWTADCNRCNFIQFAPGAEVKNTHYLSYEQAWVDVALTAGEYNMFAAPLKEMYTGDMFASNAVTYTNYANCWMMFDFKTDKVDRFAPKVYQRVWNRSVQNAAADDGGFVAVNPDENHWTAPFNLVAQSYDAGQGVLVRPGTEGEGNARSTFRFPKQHKYYKYYDLLTEKELNREEAILRNSVDVGRFIYEDASGNVKFPYHVKLENERPGDMYLAGNPFMWSLSAKAFFEANPAVGKIRFLTKNGAGYGYTTWTRESVTADQWIKPAQAFLVQVAPAYRDMYRYKLTVHFVGE